MGAPPSKMANVALLPSSQTPPQLNSHFCSQVIAESCFFVTCESFISLPPAALLKISRTAFPFAFILTQSDQKCNKKEG
jgi:hypothetical protein